MRQSVEMCRELIAGGARGLHFYTLNLEKSTKEILLELQLINKEQLRRVLPWVNVRPFRFLHYVN